MIVSSDEAQGGWRDAGEEQARAYLQHFLQEHATELQGILCGYVARMHLGAGSDIEVIAADIFQETVIELLAHADRFNPAMQPRAWFLAIAANMLKRHRARAARRYRFEVLLGGSDSEDQQDILDRLMSYTGSVPGPEQTLVEQESVSQLLALGSPDDARLLNMVLIEGWDANALASVLHISPGTARVRVHRALGRLRKAWQTAEQGKERGKHNG